MPSNDNDNDHQQDQQQRKRQRREVVSEEEYNSTLSDIIQRDYYCSIPQLQLKAAVLQKREEGDIAGAVQVRRTARKLQQQDDALQLIEDQEETKSYRETARPLHRESLTGFHSRVTSEDNHEFQQVQHKEIQENRLRLEQVYQQPLLLRNEPEDNDDKPPALACDEFTGPAQTKPKLLQWKPPAARNSLFFVPTPQINNDNNNNKETALLMPPPPSRNSNNSKNSTQRVEFIPKTTQNSEKRIQPEQTRFPNTMSLSLSTRNTLANYTGTDTNNNDDIDNDYSTDASTDLESEGGSIAMERRKAIQNKYTNNTFVNMTPLVQPQESPIITWGTVAGTPLVVPNSSSFAVPEETNRDKAAQQARRTLEQRAARTKTVAKPNKQSQLQLQSKQITDMASFSPAARSLFNKTSSNPRPNSVRSANSFASSLRVNYTPKPKSHSRSSHRRGGTKATPRLTGVVATTTDTPNRKSNKNNPNNITAGLLDPVE